MALPLLLSVRKWVGSVLTPGLTFSFTQVKVKGMPHFTEWTLHLKEIYPHSKMPLWR